MRYLRFLAIRPTEMLGLTTAPKRRSARFFACGTLPVVARAARGGEGPGGGDAGLNRTRYRYRLLILISLSVPAVQIIRANLLSDRKLQAASIGGWRPGDEGVGQLLRIFPVHRLNENAGRHAVSGRPIKEQALQLAQA